MKWQSHIDYDDRRLGAARLGRPKSGLSVRLAQAAHSAAIR